MRPRTLLTLGVVVVAGLLVAIPLARDGDEKPVSAPEADVLSRFQSTSAQEQGEVVRVDYKTRYDNATIDKRALVYLPAGYDEQDQATRYDILYLMHGAGMGAESFFGGAGESSALKNILDHMIEERQMRPTIVVTPTFYPDGNASLDLHYAGELDRAFPVELENDLMPAVEGRYRTYAPTTDAAGFTASREHRAFGGFSMGAVTTWYAFIDSLDYVKYFMPMAGDSWVIQDSGGASAPEETAAHLDKVARGSGYQRDDYLIAASVGSNDGTKYQMEPQIREMRELPDSFDDGNLRYTEDPDGGHDLESVYRQFFRSIPLFF
ncbi:enterochelin esterase-like enzyme [Actinoplanes lutulentus]|uniref:Enterochelin esterase-like enzyme n=1 Tax=Actinoplanes lutulentus TaxID=1287878 RepID=A0A327Z3G3_9ACTN|nr:alpha/beta hydrolase-fold protein [Actinoplanes lutulentus]MBB2946330.1 enterochelin esterase-like enzyme [Actinoplanes lutulentus]RAK28731.1 enterochelin esterase-like enzyme [Actinoplanes lutulentus]